MIFNTIPNALPDAAWRAYESELIDQYLHPGFNPVSPPQVLELLERDNIGPQYSEAVQKVNRYAAAAAAIFTIGSEVIEGQGPAAVFKDIVQRPVRGLDTARQNLIKNVGSTWRRKAQQLDTDNSSPLHDYLMTFDKYSLYPGRPPLSVTSSHIVRGGDIIDFEGYLEKVAQLTRYEGDRHQRRGLFHALAPIQVGRAVVHITTTGHATPRWERVYPKLTHRAGAPTMRDRTDGSALWKGGNRPDFEPTPLLRCPAHRTNVPPNQPLHRGQTTYKNLLHASINEGFSREIL